MKKRSLIIYYIMLTSFTVYVILDTLVLTKVYKKVNNISTTNYNGTYTDNSYEDENIKIDISTYREYNTNIYVANIYASSNYLKTVFANNSYGKNVTSKTSSIASANNAILAINGDYYGVQESGYVLRNGVIYRDKPKSNQEDLVIYENGTFEIINENNVSLEKLKEKGAYQVLSFGPALLIDGVININETKEVSKSMASNPRTALGIIDENHYIFIVSDGRTNENKGLSLYQLATFAKSIGVKTLYNLDGGGSSTMYFNGKVINNPTTNGKKIAERMVSDIVYIGY